MCRVLGFECSRTETRDDDFSQQGTTFFPGSSLAGNGLLVSDGDIWKRQRWLSNPAFRKAAITTYAEVCSNVRSGIYVIIHNFNNGFKEPTRLTSELYKCSAVLLLGGHHNMRES